VGGKLTQAWTRKEGKNPKGGLNAKGRASYNAANPGKPGLNQRRSQKAKKTLAEGIHSARG
jgi:hypothetical protein